MEIRLSQYAVPQVLRHRHQAYKVFGSFIDAEYVFHYVEKGVCNFRLEDRLYLLDAGHVILIPPYLPHALLPAGEGYAHLVVIHFSYRSYVDSATGFPMVVSLASDDQARLSEVYCSLAEEADQKRTGSEFIVAGLMLELLGLHARNSGSSPAPTRTPSKAWRNVEEAIRLMHREFAKDWSIHEMSRAVGLSSSHFCKAFKEYTGHSPHDFLNHMRVENAKSLLCASKLNCSEAAERVGFSSVHVFSKVFRRHVGLPPTQWVTECLPQPNQLK